MTTLLPLEIEEQLAGMSPAEWSVLVAKVRAPDVREALRTAAAHMLSGPSLDAFAECADVSRFVDEAGQIDEQKVVRHLIALLPANRRDYPGGS